MHRYDATDLSTCNLQTTLLLAAPLNAATSSADVQMEIAPRDVSAGDISEDLDWVDDTGECSRRWM